MTVNSLHTLRWQFVRYLHRNCFHQVLPKCSHFHYSCVNSMPTHFHRHIPHACTREPNPELPKALVWQERAREVLSKPWWLRWPHPVACTHQQVLGTVVGNLPGALDNNSDGAEWYRYNTSSLQLISYHSLVDQVKLGAVGLLTFVWQPFSNRIFGYYRLCVYNS